MEKYEKIKHQIFKYMVPYEDIAELFNDVCEYNDVNNTYCYNNVTFKRAKFNNVIKCHLNNLSKFYHDSKKEYILNGNTFKGINTIIRQLCKLHKIGYERSLKYIFGDYNIHYTIFIDDDEK